MEEFGASIWEDRDESCRGRTAAREEGDMGKETGVCEGEKAGGEAGTGSERERVQMQENEEPELWGKRKSHYIFFEKPSEAYT